MSKSNNISKLYVLSFVLLLILFGGLFHYKRKPQRVNSGIGPTDQKNAPTYQNKKTDYSQVVEEKPLKYTFPFIDYNFLNKGLYNIQAIDSEAVPAAEFQSTQGQDIVTYVSRNNISDGFSSTRLYRLLNDNCFYLGFSWRLRSELFNANAKIILSKYLDKNGESGVILKIKTDPVTNNTIPCLVWLQHDSIKILDWTPPEIANDKSDNYGLIQYIEYFDSPIIIKNFYDMLKEADDTVLIETVDLLDIDLEVLRNQ